MNINIADIKRPSSMLNEEQYWRARSVNGSNQLLIRLRAEHDYNIRMPAKPNCKKPSRSSKQVIPQIAVYPVIPPDEPYQPTIVPTTRQIQEVVAEHYGITRAQLIGTSRKLRFMIPRHAAVYIARTVTRFSTLQLGRFFGGKDHTVILNSENRMKKLMRDDADVAQTIAVLIEQITGLQQ
jgi:hypothetical protein